ncbi:OLC1v1037469C2 [Oldenlandia corymbosa var. corymbosa]|uniref:Signal peptidase complex catalytic subunit SEC11 n=1 Tax=Oldenlandia corymbosa var. corymbosa TaxID=529605 RepID=A0AAV1E506_OLDCO|nr:OLC1v1037469C2 [Oldenlandia corymbosa var. corymbosa]
MDLMGWIGSSVESLKSIRIRKALNEAISIGVLVSTALILWKTLMVITGTESPMVVVVSGSMEPGFKRDRPVPIVHRVIKVHERKDTKEVFFLTKGDNNKMNDIALYAPGQDWLEQRHIMGRAVGVLRYIGWMTIILTEQPIVKYAIIGAVGLMVIIVSKD